MIAMDFSHSDLHITFTLSKRGLELTMTFEVRFGEVQASTTIMHSSRMRTSRLLAIARACPGDVSGVAGPGGRHLNDPEADTSLWTDKHL